MPEGSFEGLEMVITTEVNNSLVAIDKLIAKMRSLKSSLNLGKAVDKISSQLTSLNASMSQLGDTSKLDAMVKSLVPLSQMQPPTNLNKVLTSLGKLPTIFSSYTPEQLTAFEKSVEKVTFSITPLVSEMSRLARAYDMLPPEIRKVVTVNADLAKSNRNVANSVGKSLKQILNFGKALYVMRTAIRISRQWIDASNAYVENLNLFRAAMGKYADAELDFADKVQSVIGINKDMWVRQQGVFMALLTGFGNTMEASAMMSRNLTQLGYDISSFFNIDVEQAMLKVQSAVAGELEPVRRIGYDLSQARMKMTAEQMLAADALGKLDMSDLQLTATAAAKGINVTVSTLTQQEKSILRYILLMDQLKIVQGDMARTLESPANQLRILGENIRQLQIQLGNVLIPLLLRVVPIITATTMALRDMAAQVAAFFGFKMPEFDYSSVLEMQEASENMATGFEDSADAAKKLKNLTAGFDELNIIGDQTAVQGATANEMFTNLLSGIDLQGYDFLQGLEENKLLALADKIKPALQTLFGIITGFVASRAMLDLVLGFKKLGEGLKLFWNGREAIQGVQAGVVGLKAIFTSWGTALARVFTPVVAGVVLAFMTLGLAFKQAYDKSKPVRDAMERLGNESGRMRGLYEAVQDFKNAILDTFDRIKSNVEPVLENLKSKFVAVWQDGVMPLWNSLVTSLSPIFVTLVDLLTFLWVNVLDPLVGLLGGVFKLALDGIGWILENVVTPAFQTLSTILTILLDNIITPLLNYVEKTFGPTFERIFGWIGDKVQWFTDKISNLKQTWEDFLAFFNKTFPASDVAIQVRAGAEERQLQANGGIVEDGLFEMSHNEIAGKFNNGRTVVANNQMIVEGISAGVYEAVVAAMGSSGGSGDQSINVYLSGKQINAEIEKVQRERGRKILGNQLA